MAATTAIPDDVAARTRVASVFAPFVGHLRRFEYRYARCSPRKPDSLASIARAIASTGAFDHIRVRAATDGMSRTVACMPGHLEHVAAGHVQMPLCQLVPFEPFDKECVWLAYTAPCVGNRQQHGAGFQTDTEYMYVFANDGRRFDPTRYIDSAIVKSLTDSGVLTNDDTPQCTSVDVSGKGTVLVVAGQVYMDMLIDHFGQKSELVRLLTGKMMCIIVRAIKPRKTQRRPIVRRRPNRPRTPPVPYASLSTAVCLPQEGA